MQILKLAAWRMQVEDLMVMGRGVPTSPSMKALDPTDPTFASTPLVHAHTLSYTHKRAAPDKPDKPQGGGGPAANGGLGKLIARGAAMGHFGGLGDADNGGGAAKAAALLKAQGSSDISADDSNSDGMSEADNMLSGDGRGGVLTASKSGPSMINLLKHTRPDAGGGGKGGKEARNRACACAHLCVCTCGGWGWGPGTG